MKTKSEIVGQLLKDGKITAEEAVVLLQGPEKEYVYIPQPYPVYPVYPSWPIVTYGTYSIGTTNTLTATSN
jgi:hypothetical protein